tara:strand:- start:740 stop:1372 length:633 start_codon:yes stop_codon:yes gene_type:complete
MAVTINGSSNTITGLAAGGLPDDSINLADLSATGTASSSTFLRGDNSWAEAGGNIKHASEWRVTTSFSSGETEAAVTSHWEEADHAGYTRLGSAMSQSYGKFAFPETGIWRVDFMLHASLHNAHSRWLEALIQYTSDDGSNYTNMGYSAFNLFDSDSTTNGTSRTTAFVDITNTGQTKVRFKMFAVTGSILQGSSTQTVTGAWFTRLGDT